MMRRPDIPPALLGPLYMVWSCVLFVIVWALIRYVTGTVHVFIVVFFRTFFGVVAMAPFFWRHRGDALRTKRPGLHLVRGLCAVGATFAVFYAVTVVPLGDLVAITFAAPVFATVGAVFLLGESIRWRRVMAIVAGFAGVLIVLRPGFQEMTPGILVAVSGALFTAGSLVSIKALTSTEKPETVVAYSFLTVLPVSGLATLYVWSPPSLWELFLLVVMGGLVATAQTAMTRAFQYGEATAVLPFDFVRLILAATIGAVVFDESVDLWTWVGAAVILGSTVYAAHREARAAKAAPPPAGSGGVG